MKSHTKGEIKNKLSLPPYDNFPELLSDRILMREILLEDCNDIVEISRFDGKPARSADEAREMFKKIDDIYKEGRLIHWGICINGSREIIGTCGYYRGFENDTGEIGCILKKEFEGKGFMTDAMVLAMNFGFTNIKLKRIIAITTPDNNRAIRLVEKLGFQKSSSHDNKLTYVLENSSTNMTL